VCARVALDRLLGGRSSAALEVSLCLRQIPIVAQHLTYPVHRGGAPCLGARLFMVERWSSPLPNYFTSGPRSGQTEYIRWRILGGFCLS
jgi:hypothetical protein